MTMLIVQVSLDDANKFSNKYSSRFSYIDTCEFAIGIVDGAGDLHGVAICRQPANNETGERTLEIACLSTDGWYCADLLLYKACLRFARNMGYSKAVTLAASDRSTNTLMTKLGFISVDELKGLKRLKSKRRKQEIRWVRELSKNE